MHDDIFTKGSRGQFRGDFSRDTFDPKRHYSRVLMQQGRVQIDADWNEQASIFTNYLRTLCSDLIGPHGAPHGEDGGAGTGFKISVKEDSILIEAGHYYVNGILCINEEQTNFEHQPYFNAEKFAPGEYLLYLDVWERHISYIEDDYIREKALGGPDTASRAQIIWQLKAHAFEREEDVTGDFRGNYKLFLETIKPIAQPVVSLLRARAKREQPEKSPCLISPESSYRGTENQLYRVEVHQSGYTNSNPSPTFKWSRENSSVTFPIIKQDGNVITLEHLGLDERFGLQPNDWVELLDDDIILNNTAGDLIRVEAIDSENMEVILQHDPWEVDPNKHAYLRRWDHKTGTETGIDISESGNSDDLGDEWYLLEDGIEIQFPAATTNSQNQSVSLYQRGDYWLIPARTATGDVEWPGPIEKPDALPPQGVEHHYAPIWKISVDGDNRITAKASDDQRRKLKKMWG